MRRMRLVVVAGCAVGALLLPATALAAEPYDDYDQQTLSPLDAGGHEIPVAPSGFASYATPEFSTYQYTVQYGEQYSLNWCWNHDHYSHTGSTAWARFNSRVEGTATFSVVSKSYDAVLNLWTTPHHERGTGDVTAVSYEACVDDGGTGAVGQPSEEIRGIHVDPNRLYHVAVGGLCARSTQAQPQSCPDPSLSEWGDTVIRVDFTPNNRDGDQVADTIDTCPDQQGPPENNGCPEPAPPPPPPPEEPVSAEEQPPECNVPAGLPLDVAAVTVNGGAIATRTSAVELGLSWPRGATEVLVANDGGGPFERFPLKRCIRWQLRSSGAERSARVVYVRFGGTGLGTGQVTDDIILDARPPKVLDAEVLARNKRRKKIAVAAHDADSGVDMIEILDGQSRLIRRFDVCPATSSRCERDIATVLTVRSKRRPQLVRAIDAAGNESSLRTFQATGCRDGVRGVVDFKLTCLFEGKACRARFADDYRRFGFRCRRGRLEN